MQDIKRLILSMPEGDANCALSARQLMESFSGPQPVLGRLQDELVWLARWQGRKIPEVARPLMAVFAGTHAVAEDFRDGDLVAIARKRVEGLTNGQAPVRGIASEINSAFKVYEMGVEYPVNDIRETASLSERESAAAIAFGMEIVAEGADIIGLGNAGLGSATAAAAICLGLYGGAPEYWAGAHDHSAENRIRAVEKAVSQSQGLAQEPLDYLHLFGGRDIAGLVGAIVAARHQSIPVVLDGFVVCTAAAIIHNINPMAIDHCCAGGLTTEPAHEALLDRLGLSVVNNYGVSLGDGTGAALSIALLKSAAAGLKTLQD